MKSIIKFLLIFSLLILTIVTSSYEDTSSIPICPLTTPICQHHKNWTISQLKSRINSLEPGEGKGFVHQDGLTFVYRQSSLEYYQVFALIRYHDDIEMQNVPESDWWTLTIQFEDIDKSILTFGISEIRYVSRTLKQLPKKD